MNNKLSYIFLGLFALASLLELVFAFLEKEKYRRIVKPFCLAFLVTFAVIERPDQPYIYIGAFFGLIGDLFLIPKGKKMYFVLGTIAFLFGHLFYDLQLLTVLVPKVIGSNVPIQVPLFGLAGVVVLTLCLIPITVKVAKSRVIGVAGAFYISFLLSVSGFAIYAICVGAFKYAILVLIGGLLFVSSDTCIIVFRFMKSIKRADFYVMLLYLLGQLGIVLGLLLTTNTLIS